MEAHGISKTELKKLMKEAVISVLTERKDLLEDAVSEAILDMKLGLAIEEGDTGEYVPESEVLSKLRDWPMEIVYGKGFSKDLDAIRNESKIKVDLLKLIENIKGAGSLSDLKNVRKIEGYQGYFRIKVGDYRLGIKLTQNRVELIRFLHRKDIYRRFP
jgi:mRNA interferase RelE/StbE